MEMERTTNNTQDRLSSLPQQLLISIISLLPLNSAAVTSALSHQWRYLWTETTSIILSDRMGFDTALTQSSSKAFQPEKRHGITLTLATVNHILSQLTSSTIRILDLSYLFTTSEEVEPFFDHVRDRGVEVLRFGLTHRDNTFTLNVAAWVFECDSLVILELKSTDINQNEINRFSLPKLKSLELKWMGDVRILMGSLFKSCPLLEKLILFLERIDQDLVDISSSVLKSLTLGVVTIFGVKVQINAPELRYFGLLAHSDSSSKFMINAPKLKRIRIHDHKISTYQFAKYPAELLDAEFRFAQVGEDDHVAATTRVSELFRAVSNATCLHFNANALSYIPDGVVFHNPICRVQINGLDHWSTLFLFLQFFPNLEKLHLYTLPYQKSIHPSLPLSATVPPPPKLLSKLKCVTVRCQRKLYICELKMFEYILGYAPVLERLTVVTEREKSNEVEFCKKLFEISRSSSKCEIGYRGFSVLHEYSKCFDDGKLVYVTTDS